ncbi:Uncharacterised protein [Mycobacteroides abscessus]|nr:Uncharacterised protein [Mycobacteroides abscessus]
MPDSVYVRCFHTPRWRFAFLVTVCSVVQFPVAIDVRYALPVVNRYPLPAVPLVLPRP